MYFWLVKSAEIIHTCFLLLGSNLGPKTENLRFAIREIKIRAGTISKQSALYASEAWGFDSKEEFLNVVIEIHTRLSPHALLKTLQDIEKQAGRKREQNSGYTSRTLDIDILFFDEVIMDTTELVIPHPRLHQRRFTLEPLYEIAPGFIHPGLKTPISTLLKNCKDQLAVKKMNTQLSEI